MCERQLITADECELCPRRCRARRIDGQFGYCGGGADAVVYRYGPHDGEEPPISGKNGSGTVFFSRCTMRCLYCQNYPWSREGAGSVRSVDELAEIFRRLHAAGCHNWNLVSPTPWLKQILAALDAAHATGIKLPLVFNTSSYERVEVIRELAGIVDVYLADLRYADPESASEGSDTPDYVEAARGAVIEMRRQAGPLRMDAEGIARSGVICRLLVLPGRANEACANLDWLAENFGDDAAVSVMCQYVPAYRAPQSAAWNRGITAEEYGMVCRRMEECGFKNGWMQEYGTADAGALLGCNMPPSAA